MGLTLLDKNIPIVFCYIFSYNAYIGNKRGNIMKKIISIFGIVLFAGIINISDANAYKLLSSKELGRGDAENQNIVVQCTTDTGNISNKTCKLRRYIKCSGNGNAKKCDGWQPWTDLQKPGSKYSNWRDGASQCCNAMGLR